MTRRREIDAVFGVAARRPHGDEARRCPLFGPVFRHAAYARVLTPPRFISYEEEIMQ